MIFFTLGLTQTGLDEDTKWTLQAPAARHNLKQASLVDFRKSYRGNHYRTTDMMMMNHCY